MTARMVPGPALALLPLALALSACEASPPTPTAEQIVARGRYLVAVGGCNDCHTPGSMTGMPDTSRQLAGGDVSFFMPGMGYFYPPNLTPHETGLAAWSADEIVTAIRTGIRPDGRRLAPIMPWMGLANQTDEDANAMAMYLKSLTQVDHKVPDPVPPDQMPPGPAMGVVAPSDLRLIGAPPPPPPPAAPAPARGRPPAR